MAKKKTATGPRIEDGVSYIVIPANRTAINRLKKTAGDKAALMENVRMLSPEQFIGRDTGEKYLALMADKWSGKYCPFVAIRDIDALSTPKVAEVRNRIKADEKALSEAIAKTDISSFKAKLITCEKCESKVNRKYIKKSECPVCGNDMRSKSALVSISNKKTKIQRNKIRLREECIKHADEAPLKYLVAVPMAEDK